MGGIFAGQLPSLEFYQEFLTTTEKLDQYMSSQAEYIDSYYFGKLIGDSASLVLGAGGTVQGAIKFFKGVGIAAGSAATPMGTMVGSCAVVLAAEGVQAMAVSGTVVVAVIGNIPGDYDKFHYYDRLPDGGSETGITSADVNWDVNDNLKHHVANGSNGSHRDPWKKFGLDPDDPKFYSTVLPFLKKVVDEGTKYGEDVVANGKDLFYIKNFAEKGQEIIVKIFVNNDGTIKILSDAYINTR